MVMIIVIRIGEARRHSAGWQVPPTIRIRTYHAHIALLSLYFALLCFAVLCCALLCFALPCLAGRYQGTNDTLSASILSCRTSTLHLVRAI
jgi:hypothetical protein